MSARICWLPLLPLLGLGAGCLSISAEEHAAWLDRDGDGVTGLEDCDGDDPDVSEVGIYYVDADGDGVGNAAQPVESCGLPEGYVESSGDLCDDVSGLLEPLTWYADADGDGYGSATVTAQACLVPSGFLDDSSDCDDGTSFVHPGAVERCNGVDDDCDTEVDEPSAKDASLWWEDGDGDGYANPEGDNTTACSPPEGYGGPTTDCDDSDPAVHPEAEEQCGDGIDNNCDGTGCPYTGSWSEADAAHRYRPYGVYGSVGQGVVAADLDADGQQETLLSAPTHLTDRGAVYRVQDPLNREVDLLTAAEWVGEDGDHLGGALLVGGDLSGDGASDAVLGAPQHLETAARVALPLAGRVYLLAAESGGGQAEDLAWAILEGEDEEMLGSALAVLPDAGGDGQMDLALGSHRIRAASSGDVTGGVYLITEPSAGRAIASEQAEARITGEQALDAFGSDVAAWDAGGDGLAELTVGAAWAFRPGSMSEYPGVVYTFPAELSGDVSAADAEVHLVGDDSNDHFGVRCVSVPDVDGDGYEELLVAANDDEDESAPYVVLIDGPLLGGVYTATDLGVRIDAFGSSSLAGLSMGAWDLDADALADPVIGEPDASEVHAFYAPLEGSYELTDADVRIEAASEDALGWGLAGARVDADAAFDLLVGAPGAVAGDGELRIYLGVPW